MLRWCELVFNWIALGWTPLALGGYLVYKEDYISAIICFFISCIGFRQILDNIRLQELRKEFTEFLKVRRK